VSKEVPQEQKAVSKRLCSNDELKAGQKVSCLDAGGYSLTEGEIYTLTADSYSGNAVCYLTNDAGLSAAQYYKNRFELVVDEQQAQTTASEGKPETKKHPEPRDWKKGCKLKLIDIAGLSYCKPRVGSLCTALSDTNSGLCLECRYRRQQVRAVWCRS
jgi:hypothetical protein